ncbi:MAG: hypothetical protein Q7T54_05045 [Candidatus Levybacteria bacterium]|nr:hypothetical protein [Candidatus Levybacteria bacterium]
MRRKSLITLIVILSIVLINEVAFIVNGLLSPKPTVISTASLFPDPTTAPNPQPPYAPDWLSWKTALITDPQSIASIEKNSFLHTKKGELITGISLSGNEWISIQVFDTTEDLKSAKSPIPHYLDALSKDGWNYTSDIAEGKTIKGVAADGPLGNLLAFVKQEGGGVRVFVLTAQTDTHTCPCTTIVRVFVSNPLPISTILENYEKEI